MFSLTVYFTFIFHLYYRPCIGHQQTVLCLFFVLVVFLNKLFHWAAYMVRLSGSAFFWPLRCHVFSVCFLIFSLLHVPCLLSRRSRLSKWPQSSTPLWTHTFAMWLAIKGWRPFPVPLSLGWPWNLFWSIQWSRCYCVPILTLGFLKASMFPLILLQNCQLPCEQPWETERPWGTERSCPSRGCPSRGCPKAAALSRCLTNPAALCWCINES